LIDTPALEFFIADSFSNDRDLIRGGQVDLFRRKKLAPVAYTIIILTPIDTDHGATKKAMNTFRRGNEVATLDYYQERLVADAACAAEGTRCARADLGGLAPGNPLGG
jgi:hypothetical protein